MTRTIQLCAEIARLQKELRSQVNLDYQPGQRVTWKVGSNYPTHTGVIERVYRSGKLRVKQDDKHYGYSIKAKYIVP